MWVDVEHRVTCATVCVNMGKEDDIHKGVAASHGFTVASPLHHFNKRLMACAGKVLECACVRTMRYTDFRHGCVPAIVSCGVASRIQMSAEKNY